jgi:hypothetical protein
MINFKFWTSISKWKILQFGKLYAEKILLLNTHAILCKDQIHDQSYSLI